MHVRRCLAYGLVLAVLGMPTAAQPQSESPAPSLIATGRLASVVDLPVYLRLYQARVPAGQHAPYRGSATLLYALSGTGAIEIEGVAAQPLAEGAGLFIAAGQVAIIHAPASEPTNVLLFVLSALPNQRPPLDRPGVTKELYRAPVALPGLRPGPYEFALARLTFPAGGQANSPHYRTGAALNYVLAGSGSVIADGKTQPMPAGTAQAALAGWLHQWANAGDMPLVILQAGITQKGAAAIVPEPPK